MDGALWLNVFLGFPCQSVFVFKPHRLRAMHTRPIATYVVRSVVYVSVCLFVCVWHTGKLNKNG